MKITTRAVYDMATGRLLEWEGYEYFGPLALTGGGPSSEQKAAAASQANLTAQETAIANQRNAREQQQYDLIKPFATDRLQNGLPFFNALTDYQGGLQAKAYAPAAANIVKRSGAFGNAMPSGSLDQSLNDLNAQRGRNFDSGLTNNLLLNEQAKQEAARLLTGQQQIANPLGFYTAASQGNASIMNAPLQSPGAGGILGGALGGAASFL